MFTTRRIARLGLVSAIVLLASCLSVLFARNRELDAANTPVPRVHRLAPDFELPTLDGQTVKLSSLRGDVVILYFNSIHCPTCNNYISRVESLARRYAGQANVRFFAVNEDAADGNASELAQVRVHAKAIGRAHLTLIDGGAKVARAYAVQQTPTFCIIDGNGVMRYRGALDDNRDEGRVRQRYVAEALQSVLEGRQVAIEFTQPVGSALAWPK